MRFCYPSVVVLPDRVIIAYAWTEWRGHPEKAEIISTKREETAFNQKQKVLPLRWFYGGKQPADNPFLKAAYEPARP